MRLRVPLVILFLLAAAAIGCGTTPHVIAYGAITNAGSVVAELDWSNNRVYERATNELLAGLHDAGASASYDQAVVPYNAEYDARVRAIAAMSNALYAAAALNDSGGDVTAIRRGAAMALAALEENLGVLQEGHVLPPVPIPPAVFVVVHTLSQLAHPGDAGMDGGVADGRA